MATKAQERQALKSIEELLSSLGEGSYLGIAFEGCLADAESNIENDFALSMKSRYQSAQERIETLQKTVELLKQKRSSESEANRLVIEDLEHQISRRETDSNILGQTLLTVKEELRETKAELRKTEDELRETKAKLAEVDSDNEDLVSWLNEALAQGFKPETPLRALHTCLQFKVPPSDFDESFEDDFDFDPDPECDLDCPFCSGEVYTAEEMQTLKSSYRETALGIRSERDNLVEVLASIKQERDAAESTLDKLMTLDREEAIAFLDRIREVNSARF